MCTSTAMSIKKNITSTWKTEDYSTTGEDGKLQQKKQIGTTASNTKKTTSEFWKTEELYTTSEKTN